MWCVGTEGATSPRMNLFFDALTQRELQSFIPTGRGLSPPPRLVCSGRRHRKGVDICCARLPISETSTSFLSATPIWGLSSRAQLEAQCAIWTSDVVSFRGYLSRTQLSMEFIRATVRASALTSPSQAWLDSMAHGVPLLTSPVGAPATV